MKLSTRRLEQLKKKLKSGETVTLDDSKDISHLIMLINDRLDEDYNMKKWKTAWQRFQNAPTWYEHPNQ